jgi:hypothetical protein
LLHRLSATAHCATNNPLHPCFPPLLGRQLRRQNFPPKIEKFPSKLNSKKHSTTYPSSPEQGILKTQGTPTERHNNATPTTLRLPYVDTSYKTIQV